MTETLSDEEAVQRLRSIALAASDGVRDLANDRAYKRLRKQFVGRPEYADVFPSIIRSHRDLQLLWEYLRKYSISRPERRAKVVSAFEEMVGRAEGRTKPPVVSSSWTGRRTIKQQAQIVLAVGPHAFEAAEMLLEEQEGPLDNVLKAGGPVDAHRLDAINKLRELHTALGELLELAQQGKPVTEQLKRVRAGKDKLLHWSTDTFELCLGQATLMGPSAVVGSALWFLINLITKNVEASATFAGAVAAAGVGVQALKAKKGASSSH